MNIFDFSLIIRINFLFILFVLVVLTVLLLIIRFAIYYKRPSKYIEYSGKITKLLYQTISKKNKDEACRTRKISRYKNNIEAILIIFSSVYLFIKNVLVFFFHPIFLIAIFYIWFEVFNVEVSNTINLFKIFEVYKQNDQFTLSILMGLITCIKYILPLSLPFYYFTYREQKVIADSSINRKAITSFLVTFLLFSVSTLIYSMNVVEAFRIIPSEEIQSGLTLTKEYGADLALISLYALCAFIFLLKSIFDLLNSISIKKLLKKQINKVYFHYFLMSFGKFYLYRKKQYEYLSDKIETVYQALGLAASRNLGKVYGENFKEWSMVLDYMLIEYRLASFDNTTKNLRLLNCYKKEHIKLYKTILKNHKTLIINLINDHKIEDSKDAINKMLDWIPSPTQLVEHKNTDYYYNKYLSTYYVALYEILVYLYDNKNIGVYPVLEKIGNESETIETVEKEGIIRNFQSLIIRAIENDDVKMVSTFAYYLSDQFKTICHPQKIAPKSYTVDSDLGTFTIDEIDEATFVKGSVINRIDKEYANPTIEENVLLFGSVFILFQALLKSIELTHYKSTGFLIKFLITSFNSEIFNHVFKEFKQSPYENPFLSKSDYYKDIDDDFHFNDKVEDYLFVKMFILLYGQQKYVIKNHVDFWELPSESLDPALIADSRYLQYMFNKLDKAKNEYGLLFLKDDNFICKLKNDFGVKVKDSTTFPWYKKLLGTLIND